MAANPQTESDAFFWIGGAGGSWQTASNWIDLTTGGDPSTIVPGSGSSVTISNAAVISGTGTAAAMVILGTPTGFQSPATLAGTFAIGLISLSGYDAGLTVAQAATLDAGSIDLTDDFDATLTIAGTGASLIDSGTLGLGYGSTITASGGGRAQFAGLVPGLTNDMAVSDAFSSLEIGTVGDAGPGTLLIDAGQTLMSASAIAPEIEIDGVFVAPATDLSGTLAGTGTIFAATAFVDDSGFAAASALTIFAGGALGVADAVPFATTISLVGSAAVLAFAAGAPAGAGAIAGLTLGDDLLITTTDPVAGASYIAGSGDTGTLDLSDEAGRLVGSLLLLGNYAGDDFLVTPLSADRSTEQINIAADGSGIISTVGDQYQWIGPNGGAWNFAGNWLDLTTNASPAPLPPGVNAKATIDGAVASPYVGELTLPVAGGGMAAYLAITGNVALAGDYTIGETDLTAGTLTIGEQDTLASGYVVMTALGLDISVNGHLALLAATYDLQLFTAGPVDNEATSPATSDFLTAAGGGRAILTTTALGFGSSLVVSDTISSIEIGTAGTATAGELTIDRGVDLSDSSGFFSNFTTGQSAIVAPMIINNGLVTVAAEGAQYNAPDFDLVLSGTLSGSGTYEVTGGTNEFTKFGTYFGQGTIVAAGPVAGSLSFLVGSLGVVDLPSVVGAGDGIVFTGNEALVSFTGGNSLEVGAPISGFTTADGIKFDLSDSIASAVYSQTAANGGTLALSDASGTLVGDLNFTGSYAPSQFVLVGNQLNMVAPACFAAGTRLATADGLVPVERLVVGQLLLNGRGEAKPIRWLGHRQVNCRDHSHPERVWPVRVAAGAFAEGCPGAALLLSPDHAVFAEGVLIPIKTLINATTISQEARDEVSYWHVELDRHDVVLAENLPCESYLDTGNRAAFSEGAVVQLHPDFARAEGGEAIWETKGCAKLRIDGERVARVVERLRRRAVALGHAPAQGVVRRARRRGRTTADLARLLQPGWYLHANPDVAAAVIAAAAHYVEWGWREGRLPCPEVDLVRGLGLIDPLTVALNMHDVVAAGIDPAEHFCARGWQERRRPNRFFDTGWYLDTHEVPEGMNPLLHYVVSGEDRGLPPSRDFDPAWYRQHHELAPSVSALAHFLMHRRGRAPQRSAVQSTTMSDWVARDYISTVKAKTRKFVSEAHELDAEAPELDRDRMMAPKSVGLI